MAALLPFLGLLLARRLCPLGGPATIAPLPLADSPPPQSKTLQGWKFMPRSFEDFAVFAAPGLFVLLWASGFIGAKFGLPYAPPLTLLMVRMIAVVVLLGVVIMITRPKWPDRAGMLHSAATGLMVHGFYLGGVFVAISDGFPAGLIALIVSLQPVLTSTIANRLLGERVVPRQWLGLCLGVLGVY